MNRGLIIFLAAVVFIAIGGLLIRSFGETKRDLGVVTEGLRQAVTTEKEKEKDRKNNESIDRKTESMDDSAIDRDLARLGILRRSEDR